MHRGISLPLCIPLFVISNCNSTIASCTGGAEPHLRQDSFEGDAEQMFNDLRLEVRDAVDQATLRSSPRTLKSPYLEFPTGD